MTWKNGVVVLVLVLLGCGGVGRLPARNGDDGDVGRGQIPWQDAVSDGLVLEEGRVLDMAIELPGLPPDVGIVGDTVTVPDGNDWVELPGPICPDEVPFWDGDECVGCLVDTDCAVEDICLDGVCVGEDCALCVQPYPGCAFIPDVGIWACVGCTKDEHCGVNGVCKEEIYSCIGAVAANCDMELECGVNPMGSPLECDPDHGLCWSPDGLCSDGVATCLGPGTCVTEFISNFPILPFPDYPMSTWGFCSCEDLLPFPEFVQCAEDPSLICDSPECPGEQLCVDIAELIMSAGGNSDLPETPVCMSPEFLFLVE